MKALEILYWPAGMAVIIFYMVSLRAPRTTRAVKRVVAPVKKLQKRRLRHEDAPWKNSTGRWS